MGGEEVSGRIQELKTSLGFTIAQLAKTMQAKIQRQFQEAGYEVTFEQWTVLLALWNKEGRSQQELAEETQRDVTSLSRLMDTMERKRLIVRVPSPQDRRQNLIYLSDLGRELEPALVEQVESVNRLAVANIEAEDLELFRQIVARMSANLK